MMNYLQKLCLATLITVSSLPTHAAIYPATVPSDQYLKILSSTDESVMQTLIADYQTLFPEVTVEYQDRNTINLFKRFLKNYEQGETADLIISSAMDLQIKLVNDGYAANHSMESLAWLPDWAQWRQQAFGFTYEPAVVVYNKDLLSESHIPENRFDLIETLRDQSELFTERVGTYDIDKSGFGYLIASQDAQQASTWGRLTENLKKVKVKLYDSTGAMINAVQQGKLLLSYNVLGSYAYAARERYDNLGIILLSDYTLVMSRVAFVSKRAKNPVQGHHFLNYLLSERGQQLLANNAKLYPIHPAAKGEATYSELQKKAQHKGPLKLIKLGPALLTYQDTLKQKNFLKEWGNLLR